MSARISDGKALVKRLRTGFRERMDALQVAGVRPRLAVILLGDDP